MVNGALASAFPAFPRIVRRLWTQGVNSWDQKLAPYHLDPARRWRTLAVLGWATVCVVFVVMFLVKPEKVTGFAPYLRGATRWMEGLDLYDYRPNKGFVYSPLAAVFFSLFTFVPPFLANILWRLLSIAVLVGGTWSVLRFGPFDRIPARFRGLVFLLLLPLSMSNLDSGQANPMVIGLLMAGLAAACRRHWTWCALAVAAAVHWKVYPLVAGLLLIVVAPGKFTGRFILALALMAAVPFLFQGTDYVVRQYHEWMATRLADNRLAYDLKIAPLDLWFVLVCVIGLPLSEVGYTLLRGAAGAGIALFCLLGTLRHWPAERLFGGLFAFVCAWMVLLGPATEWLTYLLLAPAAALAVVESLTRPTARWLRVTALLSYGILLVAVLRVGFFPKFQTPWLLALQPLAAIIFVLFAIRRYGRAQAEGSEAEPKDSAPRRAE